ncbi:MAG: 4Fe-4S binding protein [Candidatus Aminicenantes bacterium]|nr:4Fe-4S binding protein [Candidatus Aminicenantes bacterium]
MTEVIKTRCPGDHICPAIRLCPTGALVQRGLKAPDIIPEKCIDCGICSYYCPYNALVSTSPPRRKWLDSCPSL